MASTYEADLPDSTWRKSSRSTAESSNCVEVADLGQGCAVRDSKNPVGPTLIFPSPAWHAFLHAIKDNAYDR